jgi:hypothetical protein
VSIDPDDPSLELEALVGTPRGSAEQISVALLRALSTLGRPVERIQVQPKAGAPDTWGARIGRTARDAGAWLQARLSPVETAALAFRAAAELGTTLQVYHVRARHLGPRKWEFLDACFGARPDGAQTALLLERQPQPDRGSDSGAAKNAAAEVLRDWVGGNIDVSWTEHYSVGAVPSVDDPRLRAAVDLARVAKSIERVTEPRHGLRLAAWDGAIVTKFLDPADIERIEAALGSKKR